MLKKWLFVSLSCLLLISLAACNTNRNGAANRSAPSPSLSPSHTTNPHNANERLTSRYNLDGTIADSVHFDTRMELSKTTADKIVNLAEVNSAYVMLTNRNAYVAIAPKDGAGTGIAGNANRMNRQSNYTNNALPKPLKDQITIIVRALHPNVEDVFITADPRFTERMKGYAEEVRQGRPINGHIDQFNIIVSRLFPASTTRGDNTTPIYP